MNTIFRLTQETKGRPPIRGIALQNISGRAKQFLAQRASAIKNKQQFVSDPPQDVNVRLPPFEEHFNSPWLQCTEYSWLGIGNCNPQASLISPPCAYYNISLTDQIAR